MKQRIVIWLTIFAAVSQLVLSLPAEDGSHRLRKRESLFEPMKNPSLVKLGDLMIVFVNFVLDLASKGQAATSGNARVHLCRRYMKPE